MVTSAGIEKRLSALEEKTAPKRIETLADWVMFIANRKPGEPWPPINPVIDEVMRDLAHNCKEKHSDHEV